MQEVSTTDRDLAGVAHRFIAETCDFLSENWNVQRRWWPLRGGSVTRAPAAESGTHVKVLRVVHVVAVRPEQLRVDDVGLADAHLFVLVPCARWTDSPEAGVATVIAQAPTDDDAGPWQIWVPETIVPPGARLRPPRMSIAG